MACPNVDDSDGDLREARLARAVLRVNAAAHVVACDRMSAWAARLLAAFQADVDVVGGHGVDTASRLRARNTTGNAAAVISSFPATCP